MRYFFLLLFLVLTSCSLNENSTFWNEDSMNNSIKNKQLSTVSKKSNNFKTMTFDQFNLFLKDYSKKKEYPDINK